MACWSGRIPIGPIHICSSCLKYWWPKNVITSQNRTYIVQNNIYSDWSAGGEWGQQIKKLLCPDIFRKNR